MGGALPVASTPDASPETSSITAAARLRELLGYVEQVVKLDERPAMRLGEHRLANGKTYVFHQHEFHSEKCAA